MPCERPIADRVTAVTAELRAAYTVAQARLALSFADILTLRVIERRLYHHPVADPVVLRDRIAAEYIAMRNRKKTFMHNTRAVTPTVVAGWAERSLTHALPGYTDWSEAEGGQYRVNGHVDDGRQLYEVTTVGGKHPRRFAVSVTVEEIR